MADENNNGWGGRTPSPRREDSDRDRDGYGQSGDKGAAPEQPRNGGGNDAEANPGNNLHVSGLAMRTTDQDLEEIFGKFGKILKAQVMKDPHTRESRGFGFVNFDLNDDANAAMAALNGTTLDDKTIGVEKARRGRARTPTPGQYHGPAKVRPAPYGRPFDGPRREDRFGGPPPRRYDDRRGPPPHGSMAAQPMRGGYDDRRGGGYDDRRPPYDDRRGGGYDDRRGGFDDRRFDDRRIDSRYDDRRGGGAPYDSGRRERDYDDRPPRREYRDEPPRRY